MDLRQFFESFFRLDDELEKFMDNSFFHDNGQIFDSRQQMRPRDMMLKRSRNVEHRNQSPSSPLEELFNIHESFSSQSFVQQFSTNSNNVYEEKIVIRDHEGNERIITKHSDGDKTVHREIHKKGDQIYSENEVISDIGDDIQRIANDQGEPENLRYNANNEMNAKSNTKSYNYILNWFWPFK